MLAIQVTLLGLLLIGLANPVTIILAVAIFGLLAGFLRYSNLVWLTAFLTLVVGARFFQNDVRQDFFIESDLFLDCVLILLTLVASFRYIELRSYSRSFELGKSYSYRKLKTNKPAKEQCQAQKDKPPSSRIQPILLGPLLRYRDAPQ